jgi:ribulose 1,5-bisphosphate synthetase/thiazole synthase
MAIGEVMVSRAIIEGFLKKLDASLEVEVAVVGKARRDW